LLSGVIFRVPSGLVIGKHTTKPRVKPDESCRPNAVARPLTARPD
jgi:hypothetical protein